MGTPISTSTKDKDIVILENITHLEFIFHTQRSSFLQKLTNYGCAGNGFSLLTNQSYGRVYLTKLTDINGCKDKKSNRQDKFG